jgi:hypothetical protein
MKLEFKKVSPKLATFYRDITEYLGEEEMFKVGDKVVYTGFEKLKDGTILVQPGDIGKIQDIDIKGRVRCFWSIERARSHQWWVDLDKCVTPEIWNSPLMKALREE